MEKKIEIAGIKIKINGRYNLSGNDHGLNLEGFSFEGRPDFIIDTKATQLKKIKKIISSEDDMKFQINEDKDGFSVSVISPSNFKIGRIDLRKSIGWFNSHSETLDSLFFHPFLRFCFQILLLKRDGFMLHACGIKGNGKGYLFVGPSGSGKSTIASMSNGFLLSDEFICVTKNGKSYFIHGTPWRGKRCSARLEKVFFLEKARETSFRRLSSASAFNVFFPNILFSTFNRQVITTLMSVIAGMVSRVPSYAMRFSLDSRIWKGIHELARG